jgi:hypothetical protein
VSRYRKAVIAAVVGIIGCVGTALVLAVGMLWK